ncbi:MAG: alkaline phosphatase family protein [Pseudomonadota bacterium]
MTRILIIVFDALRPEFVTPELMPNLHRFASSGVRCLNHHSTFPTETRVNQSAVITGCYPHRHGLVANTFQFPGSNRLVKTGDDVAFEEMLTGMTEPLLCVPALGEILARRGKTYASISAGTSGGGRLINLAAAQIGSARFAMRRPEASVPPDLPERISARIGAIPELQYPAVSWNQYATDAWLHVIDPQAPDVSLLWLCEPDESFHWHGIGSRESLASIRGVDAAFGTVLEHKAQAISDGTLQIIALSDHGQISLAGEKISLEDRMREAGFNLDGPHPDASVYVHNAGGIWVRDGDPALTATITEWLLELPFIGPVFTREGLPGTLRHSDICVDHPRAPDIYLALSNDDTPNSMIIAGQSADNAPYPTGGGCHGGLSRYELHNFLALGGTCFGSRTQIETPTGNVDILPTVLRLLEIPLEHEIDGRVLSETLKDQPLTIATTTDCGTGRTRLRTSQVGDTRYLDRAWTVLSKL